MTLAGWVTMIAALTLVWTMVIWSFRKVLKSPTEEKSPPGFGP